MSPPLVSLVCVLLLAVGGGGGDPAPLLSVEELRVGDRGVLHTVLRGDEVEELPVEIIGVLRDSLGPGQDLILARLDGDRAEWTGVAGGMSGSPVYVGGRLVGALSYRFGFFGKEPIAGITPIASMLDSPLSVPAPAAGGAEPIAAPLVMAGVPALVRRELAGAWKALGLEAVEGTTLGPDDLPPPPLAPGSPVAAVLASGDATIAATGTVTRVEGDRVWAFGHPFLGEGKTDLPMAHARIVWTLVSWAGSNKMSAVGEVIGAVHHDRLTGIEGRLSARARTAPLSIRVERPGRASRQARFEVIRHRAWTPLLVETLVASTLFDAQRLEASESYRVSGRAVLGDGEEVTLDLLQANPTESQLSPFRLSREISARLRRHLDTAFGPVELESLDLRVTPLSGGAFETLEDITLPRTRVRPGETLQATATLRDERGGRRVVRLPVPVPDDLRPGRLELHAGSEDALEKTFGMPHEARLRSARDLAALREALADEPRGHGLVLRLAEPAEGMVLSGRLYPSLPPSVSRTLRSRPSGLSGFRLRRRVVASVREETGTRIEGTRRLTLEVIGEAGDTR